MDFIPESETITSHSSVGFRRRGAWVLHQWNEIEIISYGAKGKGEPKLKVLRHKIIKSTICIQAYVNRIEIKHTVQNSYMNLIEIWTQNISGIDECQSGPRNVLFTLKSDTSLKRCKWSSTTC